MEYRCTACGAPLRQVKTGTSSDGLDVFAWQCSTDQPWHNKFAYDPTTDPTQPANQDENR